MAVTLMVKVTVAVRSATCEGSDLLLQVCFPGESCLQLGALLLNRCLSTSQVLLHCLHHAKATLMLLWGIPNQPCKKFDCRLIQLDGKEKRC